MKNYLQVRSSTRGGNTSAPACSIAAVTPEDRWGAEVVKHDNVARTPSRPSAAMTVSVPQEVGTEPIARSPRGALVRVGVIAVLTPVSSIKTSRFGSIRRTFLRNRRRFSGTSGRLRSAACRVFSLEVRPRRRRVCQMVVGVQLKAALLLQVVQRGIVLLLDQPSKSLLVTTTQGRSRSTAVWLGSQARRLRVAAAAARRGTTG